MSPNEQISEHLSAADAAAYLDGRLDAADRARAEAHLVECIECRRELVELRAVLANADTSGAAAPVHRRRRGLSVRIGMAAAAVLLIAFAATLRRRAPIVERAPSDAGAARLATHAPNDRVSADRLVFVWAPAEPGSSYRLTVTDSAGVPVWSTSTTDTVLALPPATRLAPGRRYHWYVDALVGDGHTITSGVRSFSTAQ
jgi:putative zinc finger protein